MEARQEPTFASLPEWEVSDGEDASALASEFFGEPMPWQRLVLDAMLARKGADRYACGTFGLSVPRQNGKSWDLRARCLYGAVASGERILYTAQHGDTADEMFSALTAPFEEEGSALAGLLTTDDRGRPNGIRRANGKQRIDLSNGGCIAFTTRTNVLSRGRSFDAVIYDEAQELTDSQYAASRFSTAASRQHNVQVIYAGTPPDPSSVGTKFKELHDRAHAGTTTAGWMEWSVPEVGDVSDVGRWYDSNPSLGMLIDEETVHGEWEDSDADTFARERLGWWSPTAVLRCAIDAGTWEATGIQGIGPDYKGRRALGVKFSPDGTRYVLAGCKLTKDRKGGAFEVVEVGTTARGTRALAQALMERRRTTCCVVVDGQAGAPALCENMADAPRGYVVRTSARQVADAAGTLLDGLREGTLAHTSVGQAELDRSALGSYMRPIGKGGAWGFGSTDDADSTAIEAASLAVWGARNTRRDPSRRQEML